MDDRSDAMRRPLSSGAPPQPSWQQPSWQVVPPPQPATVRPFVAPGGGRAEPTPAGGIPMGGSLFQPAAPGYLSDGYPADGYLSDGDLARAWAAGAPNAFEEAYRRFATVLFGTAVGLLGDRVLAADVVHDTFVRAAGRVGGLRDPDRLRAWLFAILRNEATSVHRSRRHDGGSLDDAAGGAVTQRLADGAPSPDLEASRVELAELVWTAADGLQDRDREVLELSVRGGLETADLADALGVSAGHAAVLLSRMRDRLERCLGALLVARVGRRDCDALDRLLSDWDGRFTLEVRSRVSRHLEGCPRCSERRSRMVTMERLAPALLPPLVVLPPELRARLVSSIGPDGTGGASGAGGAAGPGATVGPDGWAWHADGFPVQSPDPVRRALPAAAGAGLGMAALGAATQADADDEDPPDVTAPPPPAGGAGHGGSGGRGFVGAHRRRRKAPRPLVAVLAVSLPLLIAGGAGLANVLDKGADSVEVAVGTSPSPTSPSSATTTDEPPSVTTSIPVKTSAAGPATSSAPARTTSGTTVRTSSTSTTTSRTTTTTTTPPSSTTSRTTTTTTTTTKSTPPTTSAPPPAPPRIASVTVDPDPLNGPNCPTASLVGTITVQVKPAGKKLTGSFTWKPDGRSSTTTDLVADGSTLTGAIGPYFVSGDQKITVNVKDENGKDSTSHTVTVVACVAGQ